MVVAIITARGGSKGLPGKNIKKLNGIPLIAYTINAAKESKVFDRIIVSTDCKDIKKVSLEFGAEVIDRPELLAGDDSSSIDVVAHVLDSMSLDASENNEFILLQPTSPLRTAEDIQKAYIQFCAGGYSSLVAVTETVDPPYKSLVSSDNNDTLEPLFGWEYLTMPRQRLSKTYLINGSIYICNIGLFLASNSFFVPSLGFYKMKKENSVDVDDLFDFEMVEILINKEIE